MKRIIISLVGVAVLILTVLPAIIPSPMLAAGSPAFESVATAAESSDTTSITISKPSGTAEGDLLIAMVVHDGRSGAISAPSGWAPISEGHSGSDSYGEIWMGVFYKVAGASEPSSYEFSWSTSYDEQAVGGILRYSGVDTTDPIDVSAADTGNSNNPTAPSVTTTVADTMIVRIYGADDDDLDGTPYPSDHSGRFNLESTSGYYTCSGGAADQTQSGIGATGAAAFSLSSSEAWRAVTVAINPVSTPTHTLTVSKDGTGSGTVTSAPAGISCGGGCTENYAEDTAVVLTAVADAGSTLTAWSGDGIGDAPGTRSVTMDAAKAVTATFTLNIYTITASAGAGGTITPSGAVLVEEGNDQTFDITPDTGHIVADVLVDAVSQGRLNSYTFTNVITTHTIAASFENGWNEPSSYDDSGWSNEDGAYTSDNDRASADYGYDDIEYYNFGFSIPPGAIIEGIEVAVEGYTTGSRQAVIDLSWNGGSSHTSGSGDKTTNMPSDSSDDEATRIFGGPSDTWNYGSWTPAIINSNSFRVRLYANWGGGTLYVDQLQVKVYYTLPTTGTITIVKDTVPDDPQDFEFTRNFGVNFFLDDDANPTLSNTETFSGLDPGTYTVDEIEPTGWYLVDIDCSGGASVVTSDTGVSINLSAGEHVSCTFTNCNNPPLEESCGLDIVLVIDGSGSIDNTEYGQMQDALVDFVEAFLPETPTQFALVEFATSAVVRQGFTADETTIINEINEAREQPGGQYTNWQQGLLLAHNLFPNRDNPDLIIFTSDGNPNRTGYPPSSPGEAASVAAAVLEANDIKSDGIRIITIGIGGDVNTDNLAAISCTDAVITSGFEDLADDLAELASQLCGGTITVHKIIDCDGDPETMGDQSDGGNWTFTANVDSPGSSNPPSGQTDNDGLINFDIDFSGECTATVSIVETLKPGFTLLDAVCTGATTDGTFDDIDSVDGIVLEPNDIVSCTFYNQPLPCEAIAGNFSICVGTTVNDALFDPYVDCDGPECCNITSLDYSEVSANNNNPGTYSYNVTCGCDSVCGPDTATGYVTVNDKPTCSIDADPGTEVCAGNNVTLTEDGGDAAEWLWSTTETTQSIEVSANGTYGVTITDANNCTSYCEIEITVYDSPTCSIDADPGTEVCAGNNVTLTEDGGDAAEWLWSTTETTQSIEVSASGTYGVTITDAHNCTSYCEIEITVEVCDTCKISGHKYGCDGVNCTEEGIEGWTIYLERPAGNVIDTTTTNSSGYYEFTNLAPGDYTVTEEPLPACWENCTPTSVNVTLGAGQNTVVSSTTDTLYKDGASWPNSVAAWGPSAWSSIDYNFTPSGADWVWESYRVNNPVLGDVVEFKHEFDIPTLPTGGTLHITTDNGYEVYLNGSFVGSAQVHNHGGMDWEVSNLSENWVNSSDWDTVESYDVSGYLVSGANILYVKTANEQMDGGTISSNPAGLIYELGYDYGCDVNVDFCNREISYTLNVTSDGCCPINVGTLGTVEAGGTGNFTVDCCTEVTLSANESAVCCDFVNWTGDVPGSTNSSNPVTIHIDGNKEVTGHCTPEIQYELTVNSDGCCPITVGTGEVTLGTVEAGGTGNFTVDCCTEVTLSANESAVCCDFVNWTGDVPGSTNSSNPVTIHIDGNKDVTGHCVGTPTPVANFSGSPTTGCAPLTVVFTDLSTGNITSWSWSFPGGNPSGVTGEGPHTVIYNNPGTYTVSLTVSNACGENTKTETEYITARDCAPRPPRGGGGGCPTTKYLTVDWEGNNTTEPLYSNDKLVVDLLGPSSDLSHSLLLERGTHAPVLGRYTYYLIVIRELEEIPAASENTEVLVAFEITPSGAVFDRDIFLTLGLDQAQLPENALNVTMAYYDDIDGAWVVLESEAGGPNGVAELTLSAPINHFSIFGVLAAIEPTPPPQPAHFVPSGLSIAPSVERIWEPVTFVTRTGESVTITANVANDGGQGDTYTVELKLNGETVDTKIVTVGAGRSKQVSFTVSGLDYGQYEVEVAGLSGEFTTSRTITWWLIILIIVGIGLIIWGVVWGRRRRRRAAQEG